jgi:diphthamide biosynthesis protein 4
MTPFESNYYTILNIPPPTSDSKRPSAQDIKAAYRLALLAHHPDKLGVVISTQNKDTPSVDAIKTAYTTLSSPALHRDYDRTLLLNSSKSDSPSHHKVGYTGSETLDLDDLNYDEESGIWYLTCRCGEKRGYVITERDLEKEELAGGREIVVGCGGCSLWISVVFGIAEEEREEVKEGR